MKKGDNCFFTFSLDDQLCQFKCLDYTYVLQKYKVNVCDSSIRQTCKMSFVEGCKPGSYVVTSHTTVHLVAANILPWTPSCVNILTYYLSVILKHILSSGKHTTMLHTLAVNTILPPPLLSFQFETWAVWPFFWESKISWWNVCQTIHILYDKYNSGCLHLKWPGVDEWTYMTNNIIYIESLLKPLN